CLGRRLHDAPPERPEPRPLERGGGDAEDLGHVRGEILGVLVAALGEDERAVGLREHELASTGGRLEPFDLKWRSPLGPGPPHPCASRGRAGGNAGWLGGAWGRRGRPPGLRRSWGGIWGGRRGGRG